MYQILKTKNLELEQYQSYDSGALGKKTHHGQIDIYVIIKIF